MSTRVSARAKSTAAPRSIDSRAVRSDRPNPTASLSRRRPSTVEPPGTSTIAGSSIGVIVGAFDPGGEPTGSAARRRLGEIPARAVAADLPDVFLVLEDDAE